MLNISVQQLLRKIEEELHEAKGNINEARIRERIYSIKSLCELILDEQVQLAAPKKSFVSQEPVHQAQPVSIQHPKRLEIEDDANGDSLFDF
ncbi:YwdI family protein [Cytobacillus solani]|uniref:YwdI family protein n=1 Tax=Cytobacillus solani TaxID=1637975 RepID=UPI00207A34F9|nr:YwdI family protein [Cytobacillus solani]USK54863.1 YwdI family protein [Cytobacillus solani]